jgi:hypothetical protein
MIHRQIAPDKMRTSVKLAASIAVCFRATRQSNELLAKAIMASAVSNKTLVILSEVEGPLTLPSVRRGPRRTI